MIFAAHVIQINASTWLEFDNGTKQFTIDTNITIFIVDDGPQEWYYCYECNGSTDLRIQINLLPFEPKQMMIRIQFLDLKDI